MGPRNVLIRRRDGSLVVRPFRGLRRPKGSAGERQPRSSPPSPSTTRRPLSQRRLAALVGVKQKTSTMRNALSRLRGLAYVTGSAYISITDEGLAAAPAGDTLPTGPELLDHWRQKLGDGAPRRILDALLSVFPETLEADELAERADVEPGTSTLRNAMSKLRSLGLVDGWDLADDFVEAAGL
jgi:hypothetical protein